MFLEFCGVYVDVLKRGYMYSILIYSSIIKCFVGNESNFEFYKIFSSSNVCTGIFLAQKTEFESELKMERVIVQYAQF